MDPVQANPTVPSDGSRISFRYGNGAFKKFFFMVVLIILGLAFYTWISSPMVVTVTGTGQVTAPAESATISFTVSSNDGSPAVAIAGAKNKADSIRTFMVSAGISEQDIAEAQVRVIPASTVSQGATGFSAIIGMGAKTVHVSETPNLIASLYANGASLVSQPVISVDNKDELEKKAFEEALNDAKRQASAIAWKNWKLVRKIVAVTQAATPTTTTVTSRADTLTENQDSTAAASGIFKIVKTVSVSYKMW